MKKAASRPCTTSLPVYSHNRGARLGLDASSVWNGGGKFSAWRLSAKVWNDELMDYGWN
jgi:hypothetical protein